MEDQLTNLHHAWYNNVAGYSQTQPNESHSPQRQQVSEIISGVWFMSPNQSSSFSRGDISIRFSPNFENLQKITRCSNFIHPGYSDMQQTFIAFSMVAWCKVLCDLYDDVIKDSYEEWGDTIYYHGEIWIWDQLIELYDFRSRSLEEAFAWSLQFRPKALVAGCFSSALLQIHLSVPG